MSLPLLFHYKGPHAPFGKDLESYVVSKLNLVSLVAEASEKCSVP